MSDNVNSQANPDFYIAGGTLDPTVPSYITRKADTELLEAVKRGQFCYILTPRQMGKSSLMVRTAKSLQEINIASVIIDLTDRDTENTTAEAWYLGQVLDISRQLHIPGNYASWWKSYNYLGVVQRFTTFLDEIVLQKTTKPIVIFVDEIDATLSLPFNTDDYFAAIRALYNRRASNPTFKRLTFVLLGVVSPSDLIKDASRTPFNIGRRIQLTDFTPKEAKPLVGGLAPDPIIAKRLLDQILFLTGGHPFLTQKTCMRVADWATSQWNISEASIIVDKVVEEMFLSEAGRNTDDNLKFVSDRILESKSVTTLLQFYQRIRTDQIVLDNELDPTIVALKLSGLIKANEGGVLIVRNNIYKRVFNKTWIAEALFEREILSKLEAQLTMPKFLYDVYISYSTRDRRWVEGYLLPRLKVAGLNTWVDINNLRPGSEWQQEIGRGIEQSRNMLVVLSPDYISSQWTLLEIEAFLTGKEQEQRFIPLVLKPTEIPLVIQSFQWIDFTQDKLWDVRMGELLVALDAPKRAKSSVNSVQMRLNIEKPIEYNTAAIRTLLSEAFEDEDLKEFVYDYFRPLYRELQNASLLNIDVIPKGKIIQRLIEYVDENTSFDKLLDAIAQQRPRHYDRVRELLEIPGDN